MKSNFEKNCEEFLREQKKKEYQELSNMGLKPPNLLKECSIDFVILLCIIIIGLYLAITTMSLWSAVFFIAGIIVWAIFRGGILK